jgi:hypothetical protein
MRLSTPTTIAVILAAATAPLVIAEQAAASTTPTTVRVSVSSTGGQADGRSRVDAISPDGRFVLFDSWASDLVRGDTNGVRDVFLRDLKLGRTTRVSVGYHGRQANGPSFGAAVTSNGRFVLFTSEATNLTNQPDRNRNADVFVRNRLRAKTFLASVRSRGGQFLEQPPYGFGTAGGISDNGRWVAFGGYASSGATRTFVRDRGLHTTHMVRGGGSCWRGYWLPSALSADGRWLALGEVRPSCGIALRDLATGHTTRIAPGGSLFGGLTTPNAHYLAYSTYNGDTNVIDTWRFDRIAAKRLLVHRGSYTPSAGSLGCEPVSISADGRYVACWSNEPNLVPGDRNKWDDVFRIDIRTSAIIRVDLTSTGAQLAPGDLRHPEDSRLSADGRFTVFDTPAADVVPDDTNHASDVFLRGPLP